MNTLYYTILYYAYVQYICIYILTWLCIFVFLYICLRMQWTILKTSLHLRSPSSPPPTLRMGRDPPSPPHIYSILYWLDYVYLYSYISVCLSFCLGFLSDSVCLYVFLFIFDVYVWLSFCIYFLKGYLLCLYVEVASIEYRVLHAGRASCVISRCFPQWDQSKLNDEYETLNSESYVIRLHAKCLKFKTCSDNTDTESPTESDRQTDR